MLLVDAEGRVYHGTGIRNRLYRLGDSFGEGIVGLVTGLGPYELVPDPPSPGERHG